MCYFQVDAISMELNRYPMCLPNIVCCTQTSIEISIFLSATLDFVQLSIWIVDIKSLQNVSILVAKRHFFVFQNFYHNRADWNSIHEILDNLKWISWKTAHYVGRNISVEERNAVNWWGCPICACCAIIFIPWKEGFRLKNDQMTRSELKFCCFFASWNFHDSELCLLAYLHFHRLLKLLIVPKNASNQRSNGNWASYCFVIDHIVVHSNENCGTGAMNRRLCPNKSCF